MRLIKSNIVSSSYECMLALIALCVSLRLNHKGRSIAHGLILKDVDSKHVGVPRAGGVKVKMFGWGDVHAWRMRRGLVDLCLCLQSLTN